MKKECPGCHKFFRKRSSMIEHYHHCEAVKEMNERISKK